ncbi:MAG: hypothetical protein WCD42_04825, partial [Rhizomicrobium sp.]
MLLAGAFSVPVLGAEPAGMHMDMRVKVDVVAQKISAAVQIENPVGNSFALHKGFVVRRALADGKVVAVTTDKNGKVHIGAENIKKLTLNYDGVIE